MVVMTITEPLVCCGGLGGRAMGYVLQQVYCSPSVKFCGLCFLYWFRAEGVGVYRLLFSCCALFPAATPGSGMLCWC